MYVALFWGSIAPAWRNGDYGSIGMMMFEKVQTMPGFVALRKLDVAEGEELAVAYFETEEAMKNWYNDSQHRAVEVLGRREILTDYTIEILEMKRTYSMQTSTFVASIEDDRAADALLASVRAQSHAPE